MAPLQDQASERIEEIFKYRIEDANLLAEALWAAQPIHTGTRQLRDGNKDLALVGDSVIKTVLVTDSYEQNMSRGRWSEPT